MKKTMIGAAAAAVALSFGLINTGPAQAAPKFSCDTAKLIVPWGPGGDTAVIFNIFEKAINDMGVKPRLQVVTVPGQGGNKGAKEAAGSKPDGCTLLALHQSAITSFLNGRVPFHFDKFETVSQLTSTPSVLGANKDTPWTTFDDMKKDVLANPETVTVGATFGSTSHFIWLMLEDMTGMKFKFVPFEGTKERNTALLTGAVKMGETNVASGIKYFENGDVKALGIAAAERAKQLPKVATLKESGVDLEFALKRGIVAPKGTPKEMVAFWADVFKKAAENPALLKQMDAKGTDVAWVGPEGYAKWADKTFTDFKAIAIKIGMYKGK
jgi:tripartite-type tricarboxylate transporter receptor subunit TctC